MAIDMMTGSWRDDWVGHMMAHCNAKYHRHSDSGCPSNSPFSGKRSITKLRLSVDMLMPEEMRNYDGPAAKNKEFYYKFCLEYLRGLFPGADYTNIGLYASVAKVTDSCVNKDVVIVVSDSRPNSAKIATTDGIEYKARVFMGIAVDTSDSSNRSSRFEVQNFARHGAGYSNWWYQERLNGNSGKQITTRHRQMEDSDSDLPKTKQCNWYVTVFVNLVSPKAESTGFRWQSLLRARYFATAPNQILSLSLVDARKTSASA